MGGTRVTHVVGVDTCHNASTRVTRCGHVEGRMMLDRHVSHEVALERPPHESISKGL